MIIILSLKYKKLNWFRA